MSNETDTIGIEELELAVRIGVPEEERAQPQRLTISITMWPRVPFDRLKDNLAQTVNYSAVAREVREFAAGRQDQLIETFADAIAAHLLKVFSLDRVRIELRKFVLPDVKFVAVTCERFA